MIKYNTYYNRFKTELSEQGKCNMSIIDNKTKVKDVEWFILHKSLVQLFLDYINSHPLENEVHSYSLNINLLTGNWTIFLNNFDNVEIDLPDGEYNLKAISSIDDQEIINSYDTLNHEIYHIIGDFILRHTEDINIKLTSIVFSMDDLDQSLLKGMWVPSLDSSFTIYHENEIIVCSM